MRRLALLAFAAALVASQAHAQRGRLLGHSAPVSGCPYPTATFDGCAAAQASPGTIQMPNLYGSGSGSAAQSGQVYTTRPARNVPFVDYADGQSAAAQASMIDATTFAWPSYCTQTSGGNDALGRPTYIYKCGNSTAAAGQTLDLSGLNFSPENGHGMVTVYLYNNKPLANLIVEQSKAYQDAGCIPSSTGTSFITQQTGNTTNITLRHDDLYGYADYMPACNFSPFLGYAGPGQSFITSDNSEQWFGGRSTVIATDGSTGNCPNLSSRNNLVYGFSAGALGNHGDGEYEVVPVGSPTGTLCYSYQSEGDVVVEPAGVWSAQTSAFFLSDGAVSGGSGVSGKQYHTFNIASVLNSTAIMNMTGSTFQGYVIGSTLTVTQMVSDCWVYGGVNYCGGDLESVHPGYIGGGGEIYYNGTDTGVKEFSQGTCTNTAVGACPNNQPAKEGTYTLTSSALSGTGSAGSPATFTIVGPEAGASLFYIERDYYRNLMVGGNFYDSTGASFNANCPTQTPGYYLAPNSVYAGGTPFVHGFAQSMIYANTDLVSGNTLASSPVINPTGQQWGYASLTSTGGGCDIFGVNAYQGP